MYIYIYIHLLFDKRTRLASVSYQEINYQFI